MTSEFEAAKDVFDIKLKTARALMSGWELAEASAIRKAIASGTCEGVRRELPWVFADESVREANAQKMTERVGQGIERLLSLDDTGTLRRFHDMLGMSSLANLNDSEPKGKKAADALREIVGQTGPLSDIASQALTQYKGDRDWAPLTDHLHQVTKMAEDPDVAEAAPYLLGLTSELLDVVIEAYDLMVDVGLRQGPRSTEAFPDYPAGNPFDEAIRESIPGLRQILGEDDYGCGM